MCLSSHSLQVTDFGRSSCHSTDPVLLKCCVSRVSGMKSSQRAERGVEKTGFLLPKALDSSTSCEGNAASLLRPAGTGWLPTGGRPRACSWCCGSGAQDSAPCRRQLHLRPQRPGTPLFSARGLTSPGNVWERLLLRLTTLGFPNRKLSGAAQDPCAHQSSWDSRAQA